MEYFLSSVTMEISTNFLEGRLGVTKNFLSTHIKLQINIWADIGYFEEYYILFVGPRANNKKSYLLCVISK